MFVSWNSLYCEFIFCSRHWYSLYFLLFFNQLVRWIIIPRTVHYSELKTFCTPRIFSSLFTNSLFPKCVCHWFSRGVNFWLLCGSKDSFLLGFVLYVVLYRAVLCFPTFRGIVVIGLSRVKHFTKSLLHLNSSCFPSFLHMQTLFLILYLFTKSTPSFRNPSIHPSVCSLPIFQPRGSVCSILIFLKCLLLTFGSHVLPCDPVPAILAGMLQCYRFPLLPHISAVIAVFYHCCSFPKLSRLPYTVADAGYCRILPPVTRCHCLGIY